MEPLVFIFMDNKQFFALAMTIMTYPTIESFVGNTPLVRLQRLPGNTSNTILVKLEAIIRRLSQDRPASAWLTCRARGRLSQRPFDRGDSGNTALPCHGGAIKVIMTLIMPDIWAKSAGIDKAYGAEIILTPHRQYGSRDWFGERNGSGRQGRVLTSSPSWQSACALWGTGWNLARYTRGNYPFCQFHGTTARLGTSNTWKNRMPIFRFRRATGRDSKNPASGAGPRNICRKFIMPTGWPDHRCGSAVGRATTRALAAKRYFCRYLIRRRCLCGFKLAEEVENAVIVSLFVIGVTVFIDGCFPANESRSFRVLRLRSGEPCRRISGRRLPPW